MAIANLHETLMCYKLRRNQINLEITELQSQKSLGAYSQGDIAHLQNDQKNEIRLRYKAIFEADQAKGGAHQYDDYTEYTELDDYIFEINQIEANYQDQFAELKAWEEVIDAQIRVDSTELEEINAYMESVKSMLTSNIQEDFNYGLNG